MPIDSLTVFICTFPSDRKGRRCFMKTTYNDPQVKLNTNRRGKTDYDIVVYGRSAQESCPDLRAFQRVRSPVTVMVRRNTIPTISVLSASRSDCKLADSGTCSECSTGRCLTNVAERETELTSSGSSLTAVFMMKATRSPSVISAWSMREKCPSLRCSLRRRASDDGIFLYALR